MRVRVRVRALAPRPDRQEDILDDVFGRGARANDTLGDGAQLTVIATEDGLERKRVTRAHALDEELLVEPRGKVDVARAIAFGVNRPGLGHGSWRPSAQNMSGHSQTRNSRVG